MKGLAWFVAAPIVLMALIPICIGAVIFSPVVLLLVLLCVAGEGKTEP
jgi:hypothetical protein